MGEKEEDGKGRKEKKEERHIQETEEGRKSKRRRRGNTDLLFPPSHPISSLEKKRKGREKIKTVRNSRRIEKGGESDLEKENKIK